MSKLIGRFVREEDGQDLIEYALLAATIAIGSFGAMGILSGAINLQFTAVSGALGS